MAYQYDYRMNPKATGKRIAEVIGAIRAALVCRQISPLLGTLWVTPTTSDLKLGDSQKGFYLKFASRESAPKRGPGQDPRWRPQEFELPTDDMIRVRTTGGYAYDIAVVLALAFGKRAGILDVLKNYRDLDFTIEDSPPLALFEQALWRPERPSLEVNWTLPLPSLDAVVAAWKAAENHLSSIHANTPFGKAVRAVESHFQAPVACRGERYQEA